MLDGWAEFRDLAVDDCVASIHGKQYASFYVKAPNGWTWEFQLPNIICKHWLLLESTVQLPRLIKVIVPQTYLSIEPPLNKHFEVSADEHKRKEGFRVVLPETPHLSEFLDYEVKYVQVYARVLPWARSTAGTRG